MRIVQLNLTCGSGSTGKICVGISEIALANSIENQIYYFHGISNYKFSKKIYNKIYYKLQALKSRIFGNYGFNSNRSTKKIIKEIKSYNPDIIHIHNIHGHVVNFQKLFDFLKKQNIKLIYTFHDCWPFTGYCPHFVLSKCDKWKKQCNNCVSCKNYSWFFDNSKKNFEKKKNALNGLNMTIVTPSNWLASLVKQSFLKEYPIKVIYNGIDLKVFKPTESNFRNEKKLEDKFIILGVADNWGIRKGLDVFVELSKKLSDSFKIVLVGTNDKVDKELPSNIISIHRTQNQIQLAEIYTAADLFVNPTREEVLGMVNIESLACGTPVLTFKTGGSPEVIDSICGSVVECDDIDSLEKEILRIYKYRPYSKENCINRSKQFDMNCKFKEYVELYNMIREDKK